VTEQLKIIGNQFINNLINESLANLSKSNGSILVLSGESGFGKTHIINYYYEKYKQKSTFKTVTTEAQYPIGNFNLGNLQPLYPFSKAIENILKDQNITPEKRFAKNLGLTVLASIPLIDTVFYAVKEIGKDWRQFKQEKSTERNKNTNTVTLDFLDTILSLADKIPLFILIDDMHWADPLSIELLTLLAERITEFPIFLVLSYKKSLTETQGLPFNSFVFKHKSTNGVKFAEIDSFTNAQIAELSSIYFDKYKSNKEFEDWIFDKSLGVPGVACEYLKYFQKFPPFNPQGELVTNFEGNEFLPANVQSVFSQHIETLTEEDRNVLAVCSAEGLEFTALIISQLMNVDLLTCIKKLKQLQVKTGIIRSLGAHNKYGIKTTIYKFSQQFYHSYFENSLEYEEYTALHAQIANLLKEKYDQSDSESLKEELAPYLAAHSAASGDEETAKSMLLVSAQFAEKYGNNEIIRNAYEQFSSYHSTSEDDNLRRIEFMQLLDETTTEVTISNGVSNQQVINTESNNNISISNNLFDFRLYRKSIENDMISGKYDAAISKSESILDNPENAMSETEKLQIMTLLAKSYTETSNILNAEKIINKLENELNNFSDEQNRCLIYNICAQYYLRTDNLPKAYFSLDKAASLVPNLPYELRLLTLANIGILKKNSSPEKSRDYIHAAKVLSDSLNYKKLAEDFDNIVSKFY
jgi:hypothetical protein